jgi:hypothetical protein
MSKSCPDNVQELSHRDLEKKSRSRNFKHIESPQKQSPQSFGATTGLKISLTK